MGFQLRGLMVCAVSAFPFVVGMGAVRAAPGDPNITVWYGADQSFGSIGLTQQWVNVLGTVTDTNGIVELTYSLNGASPVSLRPKLGTVNDLSIGPDGRRLLETGDFNIEIDTDALVDGPNQLVITATDGAFATAQTTVTVNYTASSYWPETYDIDWAAVVDLTDAVQVTDGQWHVTSDGLRTTVMGYDRIFAFGDRNWDDYEVTVPVTLHALDSNGFSPISVSPGLGLAMRWTGHSPAPADSDAQPRYYWWPAGASLWYDFGLNGPFSLGTWAGNLSDADTSGLQMAFDVPYLFKMRAETLPGTGTLYRVKVWEQGAPEPGPWLLSGTESAADEPYGSCIFVAHHVDVTIGNVSVVPLPDPNPPLINNVAVVPTDTSATITWTTDEPATSDVAFGPTVAYENPALSDPALVLQHTVELTGLTTGQMYHFQVGSVDVDLNPAATSDNAFIAQAGAGPPMISNVAFQVADKSATATWTTDVPADSTVTYWADSGTNSVTDATLLTDHTLALTGLLPDTLYHARISSADFSGETTTSNGLTFTTLADIITSDSFDACSLDPGTWEFFDPLADASFVLTGNQAEIVIPATGVTHDVWTNGKLVPRLRQAVVDADFVAEVKMESDLTTSFQSQGILVEEEAAEVRVVRCEFHRFGNQSRVFVATIVGQNVQTLASIPLAVTPPMWIRVVRLGDSWRVDYAFDGSNWSTAAVFTHSINVTHVGIFGGNSDTVPHTAIFDYFFDADAPLAPEDDCNGNLVADELDVSGGTSADVNSNGVPDTCECAVDCNSNGAPDFVDLAGGTSADCDGNSVPDECDIDCNTNGVPDECEAFSDCNTNGVPDECEPQTDCNSNGAPDFCDLAAGTSTDANADQVPDDCQVVNLTQGTAHALIADALVLAVNGDVLRAAESRFQAEPVIDFANKAATLLSTGGILQPTGGALSMADGATLSAATGADIDLRGATTIGFLDSVDLLSNRFFLATTATLMVRASDGVAVDAPAGGWLSGAVTVEPNATLAFSGTLSNSGTLDLLGGVLAAGGFTNAGSTGLLTAYGDLATDVTNQGSAVYIADTQVVGDYVNDGVTTVQNGTLIVSGSLTNNGTLVGDTSGAPRVGISRATGDGFFVVGDYFAQAGADFQIMTADLVFKLGGDFNVAIDSNGLFNLAGNMLQLVGLTGVEQRLEVMSEDVGPVPAGLDRSLPSHYPMGALRVGPTATTVRLVDEHDNDRLGQATAEALYVTDLIINAGATLLTDGLRIYYLTLTNDGTVDQIANLIQITGPPGDCDNDGDVDQADYTGFSECLASPGITPPASASAGCGCIATFDFDADGDVDLRDFGAFQQAFAP